MSTVGAIKAKGSVCWICLPLSGWHLFVQNKDAVAVCVYLECDSGGCSEIGSRVWGEWFMLVYSLCSLYSPSAWDPLCFSVR